jgi:tripartite-type tricarboxylate transporter receptor subunit TctC
MGFVAPARTPEPILQRLEREITSVLKEPDVREKLRAQSMDVVAGTPADLRATLAGDLARWRPIIEKNHITLD